MIDLPYFFVGCNPDLLRECIADARFLSMAFNFPFTDEGYEYWINISNTGHTDESKQKIINMIDTVDHFGLSKNSTLMISMPSNIPLIGKRCEKNEIIITFDQYRIKSTHRYLYHTISTIASMVKSKEKTLLTTKLINRLSMIQYADNFSIMTTDDDIVINCHQKIKIPND